MHRFACSSVFVSLLVSLPFSLSFSLKAQAVASGNRPAAGVGSLAAELDPIWRSHALSVNSSVEIRDLTRGTLLYARNPDTLLIPASVTKLITSTAALWAYGSQHQFATEVFHSGQRRGDTIEGQLAFIGAGDPLLTSEVLWQFAADLKHLGLRRIKGDIVIDNTRFPKESYDRLEGENSSSNAYDAPITAFGVNFNTFEIAVAADPQPNAELARVAFFPYPLNGFTIRNDVQQRHGASGIKLNIQRFAPDAGTHKERLAAQGIVGSESSGVRKVYRSVYDPVRVSGEIIRAFLAHEGIEVSGRVLEAKLPLRGRAEYKPLYTMRGYPLRRIIEGLNLYSNNFIADVLTKGLGSWQAEKNGQGESGSGSFARGSAMLSSFLRNEVGVRSDFKLTNGSGLSTDNRLSAAQVSQVLSYAYQHLNLFPELLASLAVGGELGTLKDRFNKGRTSLGKGVVRAKTGTLSSPVSVSGLAGYIHTKRFGMVSFAMIENAKLARTPVAIADMRQKQDEIVAAILAMDP